MQRTGLFTLHDPPPNVDVAVDIVAVHGLHGHWRDTWKSSRGNLWLQNDLPRRLSDSGVNARVMSYGYNADTVFSTSVVNINITANDLLVRLNGEQNSLERPLFERPILFVAHSLGGIIVEKAILNANEQNNYADLRRRMKALAFFGVPHHGATLATYYDRLLQYTFLGFISNWNYIYALRAGSSDLADISERFRSQIPSFEIRTFFETETTSGYWVVRMDAARLGNEIPIAVADSNHITMCKFDPDQPEKYRPVWQSILEIVNRIVPSRRTPTIKAGPLNMRNRYLPADRWKSLWGDPDSNDIKFATSYEVPPIVLIGLRALDFGKTANLRAHASVARVTPRSFRPVLEHWSDSANYRIGGSWLEIPSTDLDFQSGYENTFGRNMESSGSGQFRIRRHVSFYRAYKSVPTVACWLTHVDSHRSKNHRMKVQASSVSTEGFDLDFCTWRDSVVHELEAGWLAFSDKRKDVYCFPNTMTDYRCPDQEFRLDFPEGHFKRPPSCFLALTYIDADCSRWTRIEVVARNTTQDQTTVVARTWASSKIFKIGFTCIAIGF